MRIARTVVIALLAGIATQAQEGRGPGRGRFPGPNAGFAALDTNGDGVLDSTEIDAAPRSLAKLDKNSDGQITSDEVRMAIPQRGGPGGSRGGPERESQGSNLADDLVKTLMAFDANGDGKLSSAELPDRYHGLFIRGDQDKDGFLTPEEIRAMAAAQAAATQPSPERRGGPRGEMNLIRFDPILAAVDTNGDGVISAEELLKSADAVRKLDRNGDGKISRDEAAPSPQLEH